jgi:PAS domain S-box-containing protein
VSEPSDGKGFLVNHRHPLKRRSAIVPGLILALTLLTSPSTVLALDHSLQIGQYAHTSWTAREGYSLGLVFAMAQTPDGYLWLGGEFGLFRFDGLRFIPWQPPAGQELPSKPYSLLVARDGTLWIGTFEGLVNWNGVELTRYPEADKGFVTSLLEARDGTIWAGVLADKGRLCGVRGGRAECYLQDGGFGKFVWSLAEDSSGVLWAGAESGLWRWKPGAPRRFEIPGMQLGDLSTSVDGQLLIGIRGGGLKRLAGDKFESIPIRRAVKPAERFPDHEIKSNKLLRDRDGGIWIGTDGRGLIHVQDGKADAFTLADGLSGNIACSLFEDREGNIWYASERGLDRFRKLPIVTYSEPQGLSSDATKSVLATADGSVWLATNDGVTRWKDGSPVVFRESSGLPDLAAQSLYQDFGGRIWVSTNRGLAYFEDDRFVRVDGLRSKEIFSMAGDEAGNLWLSGNEGLIRFHNGRFVENHPWSALGRQQQAKVVIPDDGGVWLAFWLDGGVLHFKDGKIRASYTSAQGLGKGHVSGLRLDQDGAVWAATEDGGLSRIKDGRVSTLTTANGLPCNTIHWSIEDDDRALWMYTACGLVRVTRKELDAWIADPTHRVETNAWGATDGVTLRAVSPAYFNPPVAKAADGKIWFVSGGGVQVVDPDHLPFNTIPPPVYIERVVADRKPYSFANGLRLPPLVRDVTVEFTALSLVDPKNVHFRYRLDGHDDEWQEAGDRRQVSYTNLTPGKYRFHVKASNNSGVWNEEGAQLEFSIAPAFYQMNWFRLACAALVVGLVWSGFQLRVRRLRREEKRLRDVIKGIPAMAFSVHPDGSPDMVNQRWLDYTGLPTSASDSGRGWESAIHPSDAETHLNKWRTALASGEPFENEARHRSATGEYRWFHARAVPLRDKHGKIVKWYGALTDVEERKQAEEERERLRRLEAQLAHTNRLSMLGELTASLAHEINQPIAAAIASAGACLRWLDREQPELQRAREAINRIKEDTKRAADIISGLKAFYKKDGSPQRVLLDVNEVVREMLVLLHREAERHSVVTRTELARDLPVVRADRVQLQQVLMNLMVNGFEAMGESGGELIVRTKPVESGLEVSVSDTGVGIPADQLEQIFSAFVTTKTAGTGMGLAISRTIVESHDGKLWAEANSGPGATFHFTLPAASDAARIQDDTRLKNNL